MLSGTRRSVVSTAAVCAITFNRPFGETLDPGCFVAELPYLLSTVRTTVKDAGGQKISGLAFLPNERGRNVMARNGRIETSEDRRVPLEHEPHRHLRPRSAENGGFLHARARLYRHRSRQGAWYGHRVSRVGIRRTIIRSFSSPAVRRNSPTTTSTRCRFVSPRSRICRPSGAA